MDAAVRNALERRTDLDQAKRSMEVTEVNIRFFRNETLPDVAANVNYGLAALGGTQLPRVDSRRVPVDPNAPSIQKGYGSVLGDLLGLSSPSWTATLNISYPIGTSQAEANLARTRLQYSQAQTRLKSQQLQVTTQVRLQARNLQTNQQRVESTRASRVARGTSSRGRAAEVPRRHVNELPGLPGTARPLAGPQQRAEGDSRLLPVSRRFRNRAGSAARRRRP